MTINDWLGRRELLTPDKIALVDTQRAGLKITYRQWNQNANRTANFLSQRLGVEPGMHVAVLSKNCVEYIDVWFALGKLGAVLQNLNWRLSARELVKLVADAGPQVLVYGAEFLDQVREIGLQVPGVNYFIALDAKADSSDLLFEERDLYSADPPPAVNMDWNDPWVICYTGGTTGTPKGALLTYRSITANAVNTIISWGLNQDDVTILNSPLFHTGGLNVFTAPLVYVGGTSIVCREFDLEQTFNLLTSGDVTVWFGVPTMFIMMQNHPRWDEADFRHLKLLISGGAPCPIPVFEKFWKKGVDFKTGYGLTEAGPNTFWLPPEDVRRKPGSVGFPLFHIEVKVIREDGTRCKPNEVGELVIRGPHVCAGYWNDPDATREAFHPLPGDPDGLAWLFTGDLAMYDHEGYFTIVGRSKDMYISGGENVYPSEIESVLHGHPDVVEAAVIPIPDEKWGEVGRAVVVCKPESMTSEGDLLTYTRERLARYKVPKSIVFVDQLPKTGANKIDKSYLVSRYT